MKHFLFLILSLLGLSLTAQESTFEIQGKVTDIDQRPLVGTNILIEGTSQGVKTDGSGHYNISAKVGDVLVFSYVGMHSRQITLEDQVDQLNIQLFANVQELDEVQVKKRRVRTQKDLLAEYPTNKNLIKTSMGILDKDRSSHSMRIIDGSEILPTGNDFLTSLRAHFPNMIVHRDTATPVVYLQILGRVNKNAATKTPPAIFDVDGFVYQQIPNFINPGDIDRIAVIKRNGGLRYGPQGAGGVIIINTKEKTRVDDLGVKRLYDNNDLVDSLTQETNKIAKFMPTAFDFMKDFERVKSMEKAWQIYEEGKELNLNSPAYFLEASRYFWERWQDSTKAITILESAKTRFADNIEMLKAIAYFLEEMGAKELALQRYLEILKLRLSMAQSHRDVANAQNEIGNYEKALLRYARYERGVELADSVTFEPQGSDLIMSVESNNIIKQRQQELSIDGALLDPSFELAKTRILLEWNIPEIDLEVQVIDPDNLYVLWDNFELTKYSSKQFFLDDDLKGNWKLTLNYEYDKGKVPLVMKVTTFFDYGLPTQKKRVQDIHII